jgi:hypothetical protein
MNKFLVASVLGLALVAEVGCLKNGAGNQVAIPGAANVADSDMYLSLVTTDSVIQSTKVDLANNSFPAAWVAGIKKALNSTIQAYDVANVSYQAYHALAVQNKATAQQLSSAQQLVGAAQNSVVALTAAKTGN